jgi:hypothetical protein
MWCAVASATVLMLVASGCEVVVRSSESSTGAAGDAASVAPSLSGDGRFVAFESTATNLVPGDTNGVSDIFVKDHWTDAVERISVNVVGTQGNGPSTDPQVSSDGRYVAFTTEATNLVPGDTNGASDVVLYDRETAVPALMSQDAAGTIGDAASSQPAISETGRFVAFTSAATNLAPGADNGFRDVFVRDRQLGTIVNQSGRYVSGGATDGDSYDPVTSGEGGLGPGSVGVVFTSDANIPSRCATPTPGASDVYTTTAGANGLLFGAWPIDGLDAPAGSPSPGAGLSFVSDGNVYTANIVLSGDLNCRTDAPTLLTQGIDGDPADGASSAPTSATVDGVARTAFVSEATNLVPGDTNGVADVFLWDETEGITRISTNRPGQADGASGAPSISADGRFVAFASDATTFGTDTNGVTDVFVRATDSATVASVTPASGGAGQSLEVTVTGTNLGPGATLSFGDGVTIDQVDYVSRTELRATITIAPGAAAGARPVHAELPPGASADCESCFVVTAGIPALLVEDTVVAEGSGASTTLVDVTVSLQPAAAGTVTVDYATADGTAVFLPSSERDYAAESGTLTFAAGETTKTITLLVAGDDRTEADETFSVELSNPSPAETPVAKSTGTITITDDD